MFEEGLLYPQFLGSRLHVAVRVGRPRSHGMLTRGGVVPRVVKELPPVPLTRCCRVERCRLPRAVIYPHLNRPDGRAVVQHHTEHVVPATVGGHPCDERLQPHLSDCRLFPLHLAVNHLALQGPVPAGLVLPEVLILLDVDLGEPLHVWRTVPPRDQQPERTPLMRGERLVVQ